MRAKHCKALVLLCLLCVLLPLPLSRAGAASPQWFSYTQNAQLQTTGDLYISEEIGIRLTPGTTQVQRLLTPPEGQQITLGSVFWQEEGRPLTALTLPGEGQTPDAGQYAVSEGKGEMQITVPLNEVKQQRDITLHVRYILSTPAQRYADIGTLTWMPLGPDGLPSSVGAVTANLVLGISENSQAGAVILRGPSDATVRVESGNVLLRIPGIGARKQVQVRVDFPQLLLAHQQALSENILPQRAEAQQHAVKSLSLGLSWAVACFITGLLLTIYFYQKADKDPPNPDPADSSKMMGVSGPAELSNLMPFATGAGPYDFSAMLLHLINRGHLRLYPPRRGLSLSPETIGAARIERLSASRDALMDGEYFMIHYLVDVLGDGKSVAVSDIHDTDQREFRKDFRAWRKLVDRQLASRPWFADIREQRMILSSLGSILVLGTLFVRFFLDAHPCAWAGAVIGLWLMCYAFLMRKRTPQAMHEIELWRTFQRKIAVGGLGRVDTIFQWERILLYAEAMKSGDTAAYALAERVEAGATYPDAGTATFLAWGLSDYPDRLQEWFMLLTSALRPK